MRHRKAQGKLSRPTAHRLALLRNQVTDLLRLEHIVTTEAKAREARRMAEKVITMGKDGSLHARRQALGLVYDESVVDKVFTQLAQRYEQRPGGYTRLIKLGPRRGDAAPQARLEMVE